MAVLVFVHEKQCTFQLYYREILHERYIKAGFEIAGYVALAVTEMGGDIRGGNAAFEVFVDVGEYF